MRHKELHISIYVSCINLCYSIKDRIWENRTGQAGKIRWWILEQRERILGLPYREVVSLGLEDRIINE